MSDKNLNTIVLQNVKNHAYKVNDFDAIWNNYVGKKRKDQAPALVMMH